MKTHACLGPGCIRQVAGHLVFCPSCWRQITPNLQTAIYRHHRNGNHAAWLEAVKEAQVHIKPLAPARAKETRP